MTPGDPCVVAVVVAFNRADLLRQTLDGLAVQHRPADRVIVIDNASTDATPEVAGGHHVVTELLTMPENTGGAGGFAAGIARAVVTHGADLVWIMDDDTVPTPRALAELLAARESYPGTPALLASRADWHDGREHPMNTPRERPGVSAELREHAARVGAVQIRSASFVSILMDARAIREEGLPEADYFLWNDDFEYTARLLSRRVGLYVPASRVVHLTKVFGSSNVSPGPRFFNEVRNKVWVFTRSDALHAPEKLLYGGATALRWVQLLATSEDRAALLGHLRSGCAAARTAPRPTVDVLSETPVESDVLAVERGAGRA